MPLFTLTNIPNTDHFDELSELMLTALGIPDPEDREWRLEKSSSEEKTVTISFTTGPNEYPNFSKPAFEPPNGIITKSALLFLEKANNLDLRITSVKMNVWNPDTTTFMFRPFNINKPKSSLDLETKKQLAEDIKRFNITLIIPQRKLSEEGNLQSKESEFGNEHTLSLLGNEIHRQINEDLGLPENINGEVKIKEVPDCQTDLSIEVDFDTKKLIGREVREYLAGNLATLVDQKYSEEKIESATIWIRQGEPETVVVSEK